MDLSVCLWALPGTVADQLRSAAALGFGSVDIQPDMLLPRETSLQLAELELQVRCVGLSFGLPAGVEFDAPAANIRLQALSRCREVLERTARLGASYAYVVPTFDDSQDALNRYGDTMHQLASLAERYGIKLGIEHFPGRALPTAAATLEFVRQIEHANLYLLFDTGHIQMSGEDPVEVIAAAGDRLGYVHLDDNDGLGDLHWALLDGVMTRDSLAATLTAVAASPYDGPVSLELNPRLPDPVAALRRSREIVLSL